MRKLLFKILIPMSFLAMSGCVVAPMPVRRVYYYGPPRVVVAPAPLVVVRP